MARSVNLVMLIGNLTREPELRYTPQGHAVCSFGLATNRTWISDGEKKESVEFHNIVAWNKLAELCKQLLAKGRKVFIQGRLQTRSWEGQDGVKRTRTEVVAEDMVILDTKFKTQPQGTPIVSGASAAAGASPASRSTSTPTSTSDIDLNDVQIEETKEKKEVKDVEAKKENTEGIEKVEDTEDKAEENTKKAAKKNNGKGGGLPF